MRPGPGLPPPTVPWRCGIPKRSWPWTPPRRHFWLVFSKMQAGSTTADLMLVLICATATLPEVGTLQDRPGKPTPSAGPPTPCVPPLSGASFLRFSSSVRSFSLVFPLVGRLVGCQTNNICFGEYFTFHQVFSFSPSSFPESSALCTLSGVVHTSVNGAAQRSPQRHPCRLFPLVFFTQRHIFPFV